MQELVGSIGETEGLGRDALACIDYPDVKDYRDGGINISELLKKCQASHRFISARHIGQHEVIAGIFENLEGLLRACGCVYLGVQLAEHPAFIEIVFWVVIHPKHLSPTEDVEMLASPIEGIFFVALRDFHFPVRRFFSHLDRSLYRFLDKRELNACGSKTGKIW